MDEAAHKIPSTSGEDVFSERAKDYDVKLKGLVVVTDVSDRGGRGRGCFAGQSF